VIKRWRDIQRLNEMIHDQIGLAGLETAILLIAFVVVSSVFAFAALSTGLFSSDKAEGTIKAGLAESRGTMELRGSVIAEIGGGTTPGTGATVGSLSFYVANAAGGEPINLTQGDTIIIYTDANQSVTLDDSAEYNVAAVGLGDTDLLLEAGEIYEIELLDLDSRLTPNLGVDTTFTVEVVPPTGAVLFVQRTTPVYLEYANSLD